MVLVCGVMLWNGVSACLCLVCWLVSLLSYSIIY